MLIDAEDKTKMEEEIGKYIVRGRFAEFYGRVSASAEHYKRLATGEEKEERVEDLPAPPPRNPPLRPPPMSHTDGGKHHKYGRDQKREQEAQAASIKVGDPTAPAWVRERWASREPAKRELRRAIEELVRMRFPGYEQSAVEEAIAGLVMHHVSPAGVSWPKKYTDLLEEPMMRMDETAQQLRDELIASQRERKRQRLMPAAHQARDSGKHQSNMTLAMQKLKQAWFGDRTRPAALAEIMDVLFKAVPRAAEKLQLSRSPAIMATIMTALPPTNGHDDAASGNYPGTMEWWSVVVGCIVCVVFILGWTLGRALRVRRARRRHPGPAHSTMAPGEIGGDAKEDSERKHQRSERASEDGPALGSAWGENSRANYAHTTEEDHSETRADDGHSEAPLGSAWGGGKKECET
eukprot:gene12973-24476_t